jgi:hypothetical protein
LYIKLDSDKRGSKMVISRKGRMSKLMKIQNALKNTKTIDDAYIILEPFNLTNKENCTIAQQWQLERQIIALHRGV